MISRGWLCSVASKNRARLRKNRQFVTTPWRAGIAIRSHGRRLRVPAAAIPDEDCRCRVGGRIHLPIPAALRRATRL